MDVKNGGYSNKRATIALNLNANSNDINYLNIENYIYPLAKLMEAISNNKFDNSLSKIKRKKETSLLDNLYEFMNIVFDNNDEKISFLRLYLSNIQKLNVNSKDQKKLKMYKKICTKKNNYPLF